MSATANESAFACGDALNFTGSLPAGLAACRSCACRAMLTQAVDLNGRKTGHFGNYTNVESLGFHVSGNFELALVHADCNPLNFATITGFLPIGGLVIQEPLVRLVYRPHPLVTVESLILSVSLLDYRLVLK